MRIIKITGDLATYEVSDETYEKIKDQIEADKKPKFKPVTCHCLTVEVGKGNLYVVIKTLPLFDNEVGCTQDPREARRTAKTILDAAAFIETHQGVIQ